MPSTMKNSSQMTTIQNLCFLLGGRWRSSVLELIADPTFDLIDSYVPRRLTTLRELVTSFIKDISRHQREMATHIFVLMISIELRNTKPHAIPVQCLPFHSLKHQEVRQIVSSLVKEMRSRGMRVSGQ